MTLTHAVEKDVGLRHLDHLCATMREHVLAGSLPQSVIERILADMLGGQVVVGGLLRLVTTIQLPSIKRFVVADHFKNGVFAGGRTIEVTHEFVEHYGGCVERDIPARLVFIWGLLEYAPDPRIVDLLGGAGQRRTETALAHVFHMLTLGPRGGAYRTDDYGSVCYRASCDEKNAMLNMVNWKVQGRDIVIDSQPIRRMRGWLQNCRVCGG